jgi:hypothetical protein
MTSDTNNYGTITERMRIDDAGNVGIGNANAGSPEVPLHVKCSGAGAGLRIESSFGNYGKWDLAVEADDADRFGISGNNTEIMSFKNNGNVGIGITSPTAPLHVSSSVSSNYASIIQNTHSSNGHGLAILAGDNADTNSLVVATYDDTLLFKVRSDGAVIADYIAVGNNQTTTRLSVDASGYAAFEFGGDTSGSFCYNNTTSRNMAFGVNRQDDLVITNGGNVAIRGALSKGSGSFKIDHPLPSKKDTHYLVHSFTESPRADLIYRDKVTLVDGSATVNIDTVAGMTDGTFVLLCDNVQCFTSNESDWKAVKGSVSGNILTIECEDSSSTADISWMVVGDRKDEHMMDTNWTDENGKPIIEPEKDNA